MFKIEYETRFNTNIYNVLLGLLTFNKVSLGSLLIEFHLKSNQRDRLVSFLPLFVTASPDTVYRKASIKRPGAYQIFEPLGWVLNRGGAKSKLYSTGSYFE